MENPLHKEIKDTVITFKITTSESKALKKQCKALKVGVSSYLRYLIEKDAVK